MRKINDLSDSENLEFLQDMKETYSASIESAIRVADKYGISRDETLEHFAAVLKFMVRIGTFKNYELNEKEANENRG